jgi:glycosyltransferase involved in cell wall biosynthesis
VGALPRPVQTVGQRARLALRTPRDGGWYHVEHQRVPPATRSTRPDPSARQVSPHARSIPLGQMRSLVVAGEYPWPVRSGSRIRLLTTLRALSSCGPTELFSVVPRGRADLGDPDPAIGIERVGRTRYDDSPRAAPSTLARPWLPVAFPWKDRSAVASSLLRFQSGRYDLAWYFGIRPWVLAGEHPPAPAVVDLDDLEDQKILGWLSIPRPPREGLRGTARDAAARAFSRSEVARWRRLYRRVGRAAAATVVCSSLDAGRAASIGLEEVHVVPNGYPFVEQPAGRLAVGSPPTLLFHGTLRYPPNAEGARFLARQVGPALRSMVPDARIRLVGRGTSDTRSLDDPPRVTVVGQVPDIRAELARADLVVVPVRFASGTRVKILEAFAHRVPVVSTSVGAEGLGVSDRVHLLVADTASAMASACARLLSDPALREELTQRAHELFSERFRSEVAEAAVRRVAEAALRSAAS